MKPKFSLSLALSTLALFATVACKPAYSPDGSNSSTTGSYSTNNSSSGSYNGSSSTPGTATNTPSTGTSTNAGTPQR